MRGKRTPWVTYGYFKDHRPDLKQLLFVLTTTRDGAGPAQFRCEDGNQQTQGEKLQKVKGQMSGSGYVVSFIGHEPGKALFIGLYAIGESRPLTLDEY